MKVKFIDFPKEWKEIKDEMLPEIDRVLSAGDLILRKDGEEFEKNLAEFVGTKYAVGVNSGTDALYFALRASGIGKGDEVITVSHTFIATIETIVRCEAKPVLVDVNEYGLIDVKKIKEVITKKTKAIVPVHLSGKVCDMEAIMQIAEEYNLLVIEDSAQALGAEQDNKMAGSFGIAGCFSMYPAKLLGAYGDAGAIVTNSKQVYKNCKLLRNHWEMKQTGIEVEQPEWMEWTGNSRLDNLQAAVLNIKFKRLEKFLKRREEIAKMYNDGLMGLPIKLPLQQPGQVFQEYIIEVKERDKLADYLGEKNVEVLIRDTTPNHKLLGFGLRNYNLPETDRLAEVSMRLPIHPMLTDEEVEYIIKIIKEFYEN